MAERNAKKTSLTGSAQKRRDRVRFLMVQKHQRTLKNRHLVVRRRDLGDLEKTPTTTSLAPGLRPLLLRTAKTTQQVVAGEKRTA